MTLPPYIALSPALVENDTQSTIGDSVAQHIPFYVVSGKSECLTDLRISDGCSNSDRTCKWTQEITRKVTVEIKLFFPQFEMSVKCMNSGSCSSRDSKLSYQPLVLSGRCDQEGYDVSNARDIVVGVVGKSLGYCAPHMMPL